MRSENIARNFIEIYIDNFLFTVLYRELEVYLLILVTPCIHAKV